MKDQYDHRLRSLRQEHEKIKSDLFVIHKTSKNGISKNGKKNLSFAIKFHCSNYETTELDSGRILRNKILPDCQENRSIASRYKLWKNQK